MLLLSARPTPFFFGENMGMDDISVKMLTINSSTPPVVRDAARLAALRHTALLDTPAEEAFDRLTRLATKILHAPTALVSLVDEDRQFFKSCVGLPEPWASQRETPLSHSFCQHTIASGEPLVITDAREHPLVHQNLAIRDLNVVAYAGIPLITSDGESLGSFCVIDSQPRVWTAAEIEILNELAASVIAEIDLCRATREAQHQAKIQQFLAQVSRMLVDSLDYEINLQAVARLVVPLLADGCVIDVIEEDGSGRRVACAAAHPTQEALILQLCSSLKDEPDPVAEAARTGQLRRLSGVAEVTEALFNPGYMQLVRALNLRSGLAIPMMAHEHIVGVITLLFTEDHDHYASYDLIAAQDLAQRVALAVDNARLYAVARQAILARDNLLAMASHDLRTPLGVIKGYAHLIQMRIDRAGVLDKAAIADSFGRIDAAVQKMVYQLDELVDISHLQAGQSLALTYELADIVKLVRRTVEEQQGLAPRHRIAVMSDLPELSGNYDVVRVERALINLLTNAIKYSPSGGDILVSITSEEDDTGTWATIRVQDHGIGIPTADLTQIFQRFYRAGNVDGIKGTGIGLATVEWIVTQHGGQVALESTEGVGTTVILRLPLAQ